MTQRHPERGSAMLVTLILIAALLAGAAVLVSMQVSSTRSSEVTRTGTSSLYCAEVGLAAARPVVAAHYTDWKAGGAANFTAPTATASPTEPSWLASGIGVHDADGGGTGSDYIVYLIDNDDESGSAQDYMNDNDLRVFIVSRCLLYPENEKEVRELVQYSGGGKCYNAQQGGCGGNGNAN
jgi:hypothetical protein